MKHHNRHLNFCVRLVLIVFLITGPFVSICFTADFDIIRPGNGDSRADLPDVAEKKRPDDPEHFERRGRIKLANNLLATARKLEAGDRLNLKFFENKPYRIIVESRASGLAGYTTITGRIEGQDLQTFTMTINPQHIQISLQDLDTDMTYWLSGDAINGQGSVLEVNNRKRPPRYE